MRLLDVGAVLDREKDIQGVDPEIEVLKEFDDKTTRYAILSHRWGTEVNYDEMNDLAVMEARKRDKVRQRDGYRKIIKSCERAMKDGYRWLWIDTCCINKHSSAELSEAINSMYRWYRNSQKCYVYLHDVDESVFPTEQDFSRFGRSNGWPEWFSRGWTLQELVAPTELEFINQSWVPIGTKQKLTSTLKDITRIPEEVLNDERILRRTHFWTQPPCVAHIMSWAADRKTTRVEDQAYSLLGLFGVNMPMLYGEGSKAFQRLQLEIIRASKDHSVFAWNPKGHFGTPRSVLADDPSYFRGCDDVENLGTQQFFEQLKEYMGEEVGGYHTLTSIASLWGGVDSPQLYRFDVTNLGIQVWLPVLHETRSDAVLSLAYHKYPGTKYFMAILPCRNNYGNLITINLESYGLSSNRCRHRPQWSWRACPEFGLLYLDYSQDAEESRYHHLRLHDRRALYYGFTRCGTFPYCITGDTVTLSPQGNNLIILVYANVDARSRFAVGLGYYFGHFWTRVVCDECPANQEGWSLWANFAKKVYGILWNAPAEELTPHGSRASIAIKDVHLPQSVWDARIIYGSSGTNSTDVMVDVVLCPGCCMRVDEATPEPPKGPGPTDPIESLYDLLSYEPLAYERYELWVPWTFKSSCFHELQLDGEPTEFISRTFERAALGDYDDLFAFNRKPRGNIFADMQELGINLTDSVYRPVVSRVSGSAHMKSDVQTHDVPVVYTGSDGDSLVLYQPKGLSLPNSEQFELLLEALSTRLAGKCLVTKAIQCSKFCRVRDLEGASSGGIRSDADAGTFTPLCVIKRPLAWYKQEASGKTRERFENIREDFYVLANLRNLIRAESCQEAVYQRKANGIDHLSAMFGLEYLKNFVGEITFFERLPSMLETQLHNEASVGTAGGNYLPAHPSKSSSNPRPEVLKCAALRESQFGVAKRQTKYAVMTISQTLSVGLLERISTSFLHASEDNQRTGQVGKTDYDDMVGAIPLTLGSLVPGHRRQANVRSTVQEIEALEAKLQAIKDKDEQRALEEDITGKILWFYWRGIRSEVDQILAKVVDYSQNRLDFNMTQTDREFVCQIAKIIQGTPPVDPDFEMAHLQRIMLDAGAGVSKHQLWLAARDAEQAQLSRVLGILGVRERASSTSTEVPSTSIVEQILDTGEDREVVDGSDAVST